MDNANSDDVRIFQEAEEAEKEVEKMNRKNPVIPDIDTTNPYSPGGIGMNPLSDDEKYYPLLGKDMDGNMTDYLEYDGKYLSNSQMQDLDNYIQKSV